MSHGSPIRTGTPAVATPDARDISRAAARLYADAPPVARFMATHRSRICPVHDVVRHVPPGSAVLDVGCGNGMMLAMLAVAGRLGRGVGFDSSTPATDAAARMLARLRNDHPAVDLTITRLDVADPWPAGTFDVVMMVDVMHHIPPPAQESVLRAAARRVRPGGGRLLYKDMARRPAWRAAMNRLHDLAVARQWIRYRPIHDIERWAQDEGLTPAASSDCNMLWYRHELRVFTRP